MPVQAPTQNPKTPGFPPEQIAAVTLAGVAIATQFVPLNNEAQAGIVDVVTIVAPTISVAGAATRLGRQKWYRNFWRVDADHDPSTPDTMIPVPFLIALGGIALVAVSLGIALIIVLVT
jgi:hypothetical protein